MSIPLLTAAVLATAAFVLAAQSKKNRQPKKVKVPVTVSTRKRNK